MPNLLTVWLKCLALALLIPVAVLALPAFALLDRLLDGGGYWWRVKLYYKLLADLEVSIKL